MNIELLLLIKKHTDTLIEQTKTKLHESLEYTMNKQMQLFSLPTSINLSEEGKWLKAVTFSEATNCLFIITNENKSFSVTILGKGESKTAEKTIDEPNNLLELRSQIGTELHIKEVRKKGNQIKIRDNEYKLSDFKTRKSEILEELKNVKYNNFEDLVYRFQLSYDGNIDILDLKYIPTKRTCYSLNPGIYQVSHINKTLEYFSTDIVKVSFTIDDIGLKSNLNINRNLFFTQRYFFYTNSGFTLSYFYPLNDIDGLYQLILGSNKSNNPINITAIDKTRLKADCMKGSIINGCREHILFSFALSSPPGQKIFTETRIKLFEKINKPVLSHITFYLEDDNHKPVDFNNETISFTCQLIEI